MLLVIALLIFAYILYKFIEYQRCVRAVPIKGPPRTLFIGNLHQVLGCDNIWLRSLDWLDKYGSKIQLFFLTRRFVMLGAGHSEDVKDIFTNKIYTKSRLGRFYVDLVGNSGMFFSDGEMWSRMRKTCANSFSIKYLRLFNEPMRICINELLNILENKLSTPIKHVPVDVDKVFMHVTLDVIGRTMFSVDFQAQLNPESSMISKSVAVYLKHTFALSINPMHYLLHPTSIYEKANAARYLVSYMDHIIKSRVSSRTSENHTHNENKDLLDLLLEVRNPDTGAALSNQEIRENLITFLIAGHETTAHTLSFALANIAQHPHIAKKIQEELDEVFGKGPRTTPITNEDTTKLYYLTAVIKETLRMYPIAPGLVRVLAEDHVVAGETIPKGSTVAVNVLAIHYNALVWESPYTFNPNRFYKQDETAHKYIHEYAPFGLGNRICIGQHFAMLEMKIMLATLLRKFEFTLPPLFHIPTIQHLTLQPKGGLFMNIWPRQPQ